MKTSMSGTTTKTYTIRLSYEDIIEMFKDGGYNFDHKPKIDIARREMNSAIEAKLGDVKLPSQSLHISVTVTEDIKG